MGMGSRTRVRVYVCVCMCGVHYLLEATTIPSRLRVCVMYFSLFFNELGLEDWLAQFILFHVVSSHLRCIVFRSCALVERLKMVGMK